MSYRTKIDEVTGTGMSFEIHQFVRKTHGHIDLAVSAGGSGNNAPPTDVRLRQVVANGQVWRQVCIKLNGGGAILEPGALQYSHGKLNVEVIKHDPGAGLLRRAIMSSGTGESAYATRYVGRGEVWTEPTSKYFIVASMDGPNDALLLDDKAFYAAENTIALRTHTHRAVQGILSGNGLMQPRLEGRGAFVIESPVPAEEVEEIELDGSGELIVDGDLMLMMSANLQVELKPLVRGLRNLYRGGEGLVYRITGRGKVWLTPSLPIGH